MKIGSQLVKDENTQNLVNGIKIWDDKRTYYFESDYNFPFIFLHGSSGMGKTQMAFTLMNRKDLIVYYFVCSNLGKTENPIHKRYHKMSAQFLQCVQTDLDNPNFSLDYASGHTFGFIVSLITGKNRFKPMTLTESSKIIYNYLKENGPDSPKIVMFLDDFPQREAENLNYLRFMRNVFRYLNVVAIFSSNSSSGANLIKISFSRNCSVRKDWCQVFSKFPKVLNLFPDTFTKFQSYLLNNSRPLISGIFEQTLKADSSLDISQVLGSVGTKIHQLKMNYKQRFAFGQICLLLGIKNIVCNVYSLNMVSRSHFANLAEDAPSMLEMGCDCICKICGMCTWSPSLSFPNPKEDIILFLCLMGNKGYFPICEPNTTNRIPFKQSFMDIKEIRNSEMRSNYFLDSNEWGDLDMRFEDPQGFYCTRLELEVITTAILSLCSHYEGLDGIEFGAFLSNILYELECLESSSFSLSCLDNRYENFSKMVIPFLSAPSVPWPEELLDYNYNFCNLKRTLIQDRISFQTDPFPFDKEKRILSGECAYKSASITFKDIKEILARVPKNSVIHLVFTRQISKDGPKNRWKEFKLCVKRNPHLANKLILKFDPKNKELVSIPSLPMDKLLKVDGLVIFICIDPSSEPLDN